MTTEVEIDSRNAVLGTTVRRKRTYGSLGAVPSSGPRSLASPSPSPSPKPSPLLSRRTTATTRGSVTTNALSISQGKGNSDDRRRAANVAEPPRPDSPDLETILARTPRPRRASSAAYSPSVLRSRTRSLTTSTVSSSIINKKVSPSDDDVSSIIKSRSNTSLEGVEEDESHIDSDDANNLDKLLDGDGSESDSSLDIHTPLPHLMFRDGLLSPRSKLLPKGLPPFSLDSFMEDAAFGDDRSRSVLSHSPSVKSMASTNSIFSRDPRDTHRRRQRHKDKNLLRAGMGLTTGLGWSDSEDEDAPSLLTRRLITTSMARRTSLSANASRPTSEYTDDSAGHTTPSISPYLSAPTLRKIPGRSGLHRSISTPFSSSTTRSMYSSIPSSMNTSELSLSDVTTRSRSRTQSNASAASTVSASSASHSASTSTLSTSPPPSITPRPLHLVRSVSTHLKTPSMASLLSSSSSGSLSHSHTSSIHSSPLRPGLTPPYRSLIGSSTPQSTQSTPSRATSPTARTRPPVAVAGPRPKPRTGTGMVYRTSSYSSLQGAAMRIRSMSATASPSGDRPDAI